ncbi:hypothetical protein MAC_04231 [Metarhizium acridum CQMa 102]|uniref:Uncharacterized protein n=1 Tax=Metarhizium acridum (strain CQMa 102) TaxID=655827 RepID=E9E2Y3_METAQ|nr:uncharacterized protein MAC_04231 [Metarhizium acridum CQMa 102]EFY89799.1 hypothetical protein MAC_04231 [Metarhizium acridum CQMa 102]
MALTIPISEGPFESIAFLGDRMDWPAWFDDVTAISRALNIWKYVDPDGKDHHLSEPIKPTIPKRPKLKELPAREQYETDKVYDLRVEQERHAHTLSIREYDVLYEQYRMDTAKYLSDLAGYTAAKDDLQKLYGIIYRSIPERYRAYLRLDGAEEPRDMILCLRSRIHPPSDEEMAPIAQRQFDIKLKAQPTDDKQEFIEAIALAAVQLHRLKASTFDEATAVKDLIRSLQTIDKPFVDSWSRKFDGAPGRAFGTLLDIVEEFKYKMRIPDNKPYLKDLSGATPTPASVSGSTTFGEPEPPISVEDESWNPLVQNQTAKQNGFDSSKPSKKATKAKEDAAVADEQQSKFKMADREATFNEKPSRSKNGGSDHPPAEKYSKSKKKDQSNGALTMQICPGCQLRHLIRGDAWWESCYVYYELENLGNVPEHFTVSDRKLDLAFSRLEDFPDERKRAREWAEKKVGGNGAKEPETAEFNLW